MSAVKIIEVDETNDSFKLNEKKLKAILREIPTDIKLNVISVVGAFRTGKSFILDLFLRYLRNSSGKFDNCTGEPNDNWMYKGGKLEGNNNAQAQNTGEKAGGFGWRSGRERCTTGIYMWSEHFIREMSNGEKVAVLVIDTQGMFDSTLGQHLTLSIFAISTLISSYTVYNLDKRVQEDNLQHLALFSEYGRVALNEEQKQSPSVDGGEWTSAADDVAEEESGDGPRPFQRLELLVRDWQDFTDVDDLKTTHDDMRVYLDEILAERNQKDLKEVREQIKLCYETVSCWLLPHPGFEVIKKTFDGDLNKVDPDFRRLAADYIRRVFSKRMSLKKVSGHAINAMELYNFIKIYCNLFKEASIFPEAKTLLTATCLANNQNAVMGAIEAYKREMEKVVGNGKPFISDKKLKKHHSRSRDIAMTKFSNVATMGPVASIKQYKQKLEKQIDERLRDYLEANRLRDPFGFVAPYIVPILIALGAYVARYILETVCPRRSERCMDISDFFGSLFFTIMSFLFFHFLAQGYGIQQRVKVLFGRAPLDDDSDDESPEEPIRVKKNK